MHARLKILAVWVAASIAVVGGVVADPISAQAYPCSSTFVDLQNRMTSGLAISPCNDLAQSDFVSSGLNQLAVPVGVNITLDLAGYSIQFTGNQRYAAISVPVTSSFTIQDSVGGGQLTVIGGYGYMETGPAAGIGGNGGNSSAGSSAGTVTINSGTVTTSGGSNWGTRGAGPGIGGGSGGGNAQASGSGGVVNINGGHLIASGGSASYQSGAAIGSGGCTNCTVGSAGTIVVDGSTSAAVPTLDGYSLNIYQNSGRGASLSISTAAPGISRNAVSLGGTSSLVASFEINYSYLVSYDSGGGSAVSGQWVYSGGVATRPTDPTYSVYSFNTWKEGSSSGSPYAWGRVLAPILLYASWFGVPETISFNGNNASSGSAPPTISRTGGGSNYTLPSAGTLELNAYQFTGWNSQADGQGNSGTVGASFSPVTTTWYAQWRQSLTFTATPAHTLVENATVGLSYSGLSNGTPWTLIVQSTPQSLGSGIVSGGAVNLSVGIPSSVGPGFHKLTFTAGSLTQFFWFVVGSEGVILSVSSNSADVAAMQALGDREADIANEVAELAKTGAEPETFTTVAIILICLGIVLQRRMFCKKRITD